MGYAFLILNLIPPGYKLLLSEIKNGYFNLLPGSALLNFNF
jgi:hypothetical protein